MKYSFIPDYAFPNSSSSVASVAVSSKALVMLFIDPIECACACVCLVHVFVVQYLVSFLVLQINSHGKRERESWLIHLNCLLMAFDY